MNRGKPVYSFPELKSAEILQCMADLRIPLSEADLLKPNPATVQRIYEAFVDIFMGSKALDSLSSSSNNLSAALQALEYPEIHMDAVSLLAFYRQISRLMWEVGIEDFGLKDLVKPEGPRLRIVLSAAISFAKFREEQLCVWEELMKRGEEAARELANLNARETEFRGKIESIRQQRTADEPQVLAIKEQIGGLVNDLRELKRQQTTLSSEIEGLKRRRQELSDNQARLQYLVSSGRQECAKLKSRIVHSPEKLLQIISEMQASIASERASLSSLEKRSRELSGRVDQLVKLEGELKRCMQQLDQNEANSKRVEELEKEIAAMKDKNERQRMELEEMSVRQQHLKRQYNLAADKLSRLTTQQESKRQEFAERLSVLRRDYSTLSEERAQMAAKMDDTDRLVKDMEQKVLPVDLITTIK
jgi:kinetochore protein Nuf2